MLQMSILVCGVIAFLIAILILYKAIHIKIEKKHDQEREDLLAKSKQDAIDKLQKHLKELQLEQQKEQNNLQYKKEQLNLVSKAIKEQQKQIESHYKIGIQLADNKIEDYKKVVSQAANNYIDTIQKDYENAEAVHRKKIASLQQEYNETAAALNNLKETRKAAYEAILKEKEVKENKNNYRLAPSNQDLQDIYTLENIKKSLHKPRILSMLIWQTYWQPIAKKQFPIILQDKTKIGIYKITNTQTDESYIGQSLDIYKRWCQHCKAGLGIDTPPGNKLYQAIQQYGLQNFTFELLCECPKEQLNEKEKYFIELYQANTYGYNGNIGNKKK